MLSLSADALESAALEELALLFELALLDAEDDAEALELALEDAEELALLLELALLDAEDDAEALELALEDAEELALLLELLEADPPPQALSASTPAKARESRAGAFLYFIEGPFGSVYRCVSPPQTFIPTYVEPA